MPSWTGRLRGGFLRVREPAWQPPEAPDPEEELSATTPQRQAPTPRAVESPTRARPATRPPTSAGEHGQLVAAGEATRPNELDAVGCLARCLLTGFHGIGHFRRAGAAMTVLFRRGIPCYVEMATLDDSFGAFLHAQGYLSPEAHEAFVSAWRDGKRPPPAGFLSGGDISPEQLIELLSTYVTERIAGLLDWTEGTYGFRGDDAVVDLWPPLDVNPVQLTLRWVERTHSDERLRVKLEPHLDATVQRTAGFARVQELVSTVVSTPLLGQLSRAGSVRELLRSFGRGRRAAAALVWAFVLLGVAELVDGERQPG